MRRTAFWIVVALLCPGAARAVAPATPADAGGRAEIQALRRQLDELKKSSYHPELGEQMLLLQIRHARLWFAGEAGRSTRSANGWPMNRLVLEISNASRRGAALVAPSMTASVAA